MSVIGWILFGLAVGVVGKLLMPGRDPGGFILTILLGIGGALVGGQLPRGTPRTRDREPRPRRLVHLAYVDDAPEPPWVGRRELRLLRQSAASRRG